MNYIQEIKYFNDWLILNPKVASDDIVLWYALMNLNNMCGWQKEFTVAISTIIDRTRLSRSAIYRSRNKLVQMGRIRTKERPGNQCAIYEIMPFASHPGTQIDPVSPNGTQSGTQPGTQSGTQAGTQPGTINKTKLNKTKQEYRDNVLLTEKEHGELVRLHGEDIVNRCYDYLRDYKIEKGYKTKSDYLTIRRWVVDAVKKQVPVIPLQRLGKTGTSSWTPSEKDNW